MNTRQSAVRAALGQMGQACPPGQTMTAYGCRNLTVPITPTTNPIPWGTTIHPSVPVSVSPTCPSGYSSTRPRSLTVNVPGCSVVTAKASDNATDCYKENCTTAPTPWGTTVHPSTPVVTTTPTPPSPPDIITTFPVAPPEIQRFPNVSIIPPPPVITTPPFPNYPGPSIVTTQPAPCCPGPCRLIPWEWWHRGGARVF